MNPVPVRAMEVVASLLDRGVVVDFSGIARHDLVRAVRAVFSALFGETEAGWKRQEMKYSFRVSGDPARESQLVSQVFQCLESEQETCVVLKRELDRLEQEKQGPFKALNHFLVAIRQVLQHQAATDLKMAELCAEMGHD